MGLNKTQIYERIREAFNVKTLTEVAELLGLTTGAVSQWKTTGKISLATLIKTSEMSHVSIHWLVTGEGSKEILPAYKPLALVRRSADNDDSQAPHTIPAYEFASLPLVGRIDQQQLTATVEERMEIPAILVFPESQVIQITGHGWASEGLQHGDLLIVRPINETDVENKIVVASLPGDRAVVRRFSRAGELVTLAPILGSSPTYRLPAEDVALRWLVTSITHQL